VNTGAITLPGVKEWGCPSRCPTSWVTVRQNMFQSLSMDFRVGHCQWASEMVHCVYVLAGASRSFCAIDELNVTQASVVGSRPDGTGRLATTVI
jgi:hypothetical protein